MPTFDLRCNACQCIFEHLFLKADRSDGPESCPQCKADLRDDEPHRMPAAPHIENIAMNRAADYAYRADEEASKHRAAVASESFGLDAGAANSFVTTDFTHRGNIRPGDVVAREVSNEVSGVINAAPSGVVGNVAPSTASNYASAAHTGYMPFAGAKAKTATRGYHARSGVMSAGEGGVKFVPNVVTDNPSLEVIQRDSMVQSAKNMARFGRRR